MFEGGILLRPKMAMRLTVLPPTLVAGAATLADAMERVFGDAALRLIHGESLVHTQWAPAGPRRMERTVRFDIDLKGMPDALKRFFRGERLRVDTRQRVHSQHSPHSRGGPTGSLHIHNKIHMHFVGRELFIVRPRFRLVQAPDGRGVTLMGEVESHAMLPPPICNVVEAFMDASARDSLDRLLAVASPPVEEASDGHKEGVSEAEAMARIALGMGVIDGC